jgi:hypothetical protein
LSEFLPQECELHVHLGGCFHLDDLFDLGREVYGDVDWALFRESQRQVYGVDAAADPIDLFRSAQLQGGPQPLRRHYIHGDADGADFGRFMTKMNLLICLYRHWRDVLGRENELVERIVERHRAEGVRYVEYRSAFPGSASADAAGFISFHRANARFLKKASTAQFTANYIPSIPRWEPQLGYGLVRQLLGDEPDLHDTIIGVDFCNVEEGYPPKSARDTLEQVSIDNKTHPEQQLDVVYHVGEMYFDKSLESAVRWCHEAGLFGARRIGHAIALGLDPEVSLARRSRGHESESVSERLDQIDYDLRNSDGLAAFGVRIDEAELEGEGQQLQHRDPAELTRRPYSTDRMAQIRRRQDFVLNALEQLGTVVEICPTSNRVLGGVTDPAQHSMHRLLASGVDVVIGADDPGIFDSTLADEVEWVRTHSGLGADATDERLGDPMRFRLGAG